VSIPVIRTVLGDIAPRDLGVTDAHDHLFFASVVLPGQELDDIVAAEAELRAFSAAGGNAVAQWTPMELGRHAEELPRLSEAAGVHIIAATGLHQAGHYRPSLLPMLLDGLADRFLAELVEGLRSDAEPDGPALPARAGLIKIAGDFHHLGVHARDVFAAAAAAHHATGALIAVHLEGGSHPIRVLEELAGRYGVPADRIVLGHLNRFPDSGLHREAAEAGAFLGFDGPSRANHATDWRLFDSLRALVESGHAHRILIGGDTTTAAARSATGGGPGMPFVLTGIRARVRRDFGDEVAEAFFRGNPARAFATVWRG
jgi:5-phospho-D-xylono-1,4-lactonase